MKHKEALAFLNKGRSIDRKLFKLEGQRAELLSCLLPSGLNYDSDRIQTSPTDTMADIMARVADIETEIIQLKREKAMNLIAISDAINALESEDEQAVLSAMYISKERMWEMRHRLGMSRRTIYYVRDKGLESLEKTLHTLHFSL